MSEKKRNSKEVQLTLLKKILMFVGSLFIALIIWYVGTIQDQTPVSKRFTDIPVVFTGKTQLKNENLMVHDKELMYVDAIVKGFSSDILSIDETELVAIVDVSKMEQSGDFSVIPVLDGISDDMTVTKIDAVDIYIERILTKELYIELEVNGRPKPGYKLVSAMLATGSELVEISCGEALAKTIAGAKVVVNVEGRDKNFTANYNIQLLDFEGNIVDSSDIELQFAGVNVTVVIR